MPRRKTRPSSSATGAPLFFSDPCGRSNGITFGAAAPVRRRRGRWREMRRIWSALVPIAVLSLIVAGCGAATTTPGPSASSGATLAPELSKIKSSYGNVTPANLAPFYAKEMGIFAKHGLDVDLVLIDGGAPSAVVVMSGQVQFGNFGGTETMSGVAAGSDMVAVSLFVPVTRWQLLAKSDYKTPEDLRGEVVGVASKGGSSEVAADLSLQRLNLDPNKDVTKQSLGSVANLTSAMIGGAVYAGPGHPPDTVLLLKNGFKVIVDLAKEKLPATDNTTVVRKSYAAANKQVVQSYIVDLLRAFGIDYVALNPGASYRRLHDSLVNYGANKPEIILCTHEEIAVSIAHGYAKVTGRPMAAAVHDVVGLLHAAMTIYYAHVDRAPVLVLGATGPVDRTKRRPYIDWIHTALVNGNAVRDYTKWDDQPATVIDFPASFARAYRMATTEPCGPVYLCYDAGLQEEKLVRPIDVAEVAAAARPNAAQADPAAILRAADLLARAERP